MNNINCTDTIQNTQTFHGGSTSWNRWLVDGKTLISKEAGKIMDMLLLWQHRADYRHAISEMDQHMIDDLGLNAQQIQKEAAKPFWLK